MSADTEPAVRVTLRDIYNEVLETKQLVAPLPARVNDHETRLRSLEVFRDKATGLRSGLVALAYIFGGSFMTYTLTHVIH